jgi:hypothetical protein
MVHQILGVRAPSRRPAAGIPTVAWTQKEEWTAEGLIFGKVTSGDTSSVHVPAGLYPHTSAGLMSRGAGLANVSMPGLAVVAMAGLVLSRWRDWPMSRWREWPMSRGTGLLPDGAARPAFGRTVATLARAAVVPRAVCL